MLITGPNSELPDRAPSETERCGVTIRSPRRAALLFDRIYVPYFATFDLSGASPAFIQSRTFGIRELDTRILLKVSDAVASELATVGSSEQLLARIEHARTRLASLPIRAAAEVYRSEGYNTIPTYGENNAFLKEFGGGDSMAWQITLHEIPIVDDQKLTWQAVERFRGDGDRQTQYESLHRYLETLHQKADLSQPRGSDAVAEEIQHYLDQYSQALTSHKIETCWGAISTIINTAGIALTPPLSEVGLLPYLPSVASAALGIRALFKIKAARSAAEASPLAVVYQANQEFALSS